MTGTAAAKAPKTKKAMKPVIRNLHRGSWFVPLDPATDGVVGSAAMKADAAKAPKTKMVWWDWLQAGCKYDCHCC